MMTDAFIKLTAVEPVEGAAVVVVTAGSPKEMVMMVILIWNKVLEFGVLRKLISLRKNIWVLGKLFLGFRICGAINKYLQCQDHRISRHVCARNRKVAC